MFENLKPLPDDPILGLMVAYNADPNPNKIDLGVGVYKDEDGKTTIMDAVKKAEKVRWEQEDTKTYVGIPGEAAYNDAMHELILGKGHAALKDGRVKGAQTPGGCGALSMAAGFLKRANENTTVWVSTPTWANHIPLIGTVGLAIKEYAYFDQANSAVDFDAMMSDLQKVPAGDVVLIHGACHNPTGADLNNDQWDAVTDLAEKNGFTPMIDLAYQGFGKGLEPDAYGARLMAERLPEVVIAASCSKNFGLYRERTGELMIIGRNAEQTNISASQAYSVIRSNYSMPPAHGGALVRIILEDADLRANWEAELKGMCGRINDLRTLFRDKMNDRGHDFSFIAKQNGMFSFLGISKEQVHRLRDEYGIYIVDSSRVNVAGINSKNIDYLADAIASVL
ncbi:MAG: aspartate/tyrosine/aromatic aminotransferase [Alphaproteobacteria bacterium]|nr:aspartate/tyrosine/aromatic aminotransferase [Alphaproteobacteria bacterium]